LGRRNPEGLPADLKFADVGVSFILGGNDAKPDGVTSLDCAQIFHLVRNEIAPGLGVQFFELIVA
jgi:hypothetical protein